MFGPLDTIATGAAGAAAGGMFDHKGKHQPGTIALQRGGTVMEIPLDQVQQYGAQGWTSEGGLVKAGNDALYAQAGVGSLQELLAGPGNTVPVKPEYSSINDASGNLKDQYKATSGEQLSPYAQQLADKELLSLPELQKRAAEKGPSAWAKLMTEKQGVDETHARDVATNDGG